jgi:phytoene synthase
MAGMIRYQWWRDAIDEITAGRAPRQHPVVCELAQAIDRGWVDPGVLQLAIDAREPALEQAAMGDPAELEGFVAATSGSLQSLAYAALGGIEPGAATAAGEIGTAFGLVGIIRAVADEMAGRSRKGATRAPDGAPAAGLIATLAGRSAALLQAGRRRAGRPPREHMAAFLPAALTRHYLAQLRRARHDPHRSADLARPAGAPVELLARMLLRRP